MQRYKLYKRQIARAATANALINQELRVARSVGAAKQYSIASSARLRLSHKLCIAIRCISG